MCTQSSTQPKTDYLLPLLLLLEIDSVCLHSNCSHMQAYAVSCKFRIIFSARCIYTSRAYAMMSLSICLSVTEVHWVAVHAGNTVAVPASEVEAIIRSPTNMATADGGVISRYASHC